jgi:hypothetical protein
MIGSTVVRSPGATGSGWLNILGVSFVESEGSGTGPLSSSNEVSGFQALQPSRPPESRLLASTIERAVIDLERNI